MIALLTIAALVGCTGKLSEGGNTMSLEENKAMVHRIIEEAWNKGNLAVIDEFLSPDYVLHISSPGPALDKEGYKQAVNMHRTAFADFSLTIEDIIAEENKVVIRWTIRGTHKGEYMGVAPTGKQVTVTGTSIRRIEGGKTLEEWIEIDMLGLMRQFGVFPPPEKA